MAKILYLVRHAKSDWHNGLADFDRPLNQRGRQDAPAMGRQLKELGIRPDMVICSPAARARQTMDLLDLGRSSVFNENLYEASPGTLLDIVRSLDDTLGSAMLIGHNPGMGQLAGKLAGVRLGNMPTCAIATLRFDSECWNRAGSCPVELLDFSYPEKTP